MNQDYSECCRFCLNFTEIPFRVKILDLNKQKLKESLNIELKKTIIFPDFYCMQCSQELEVCLTIREKFASNQKILEGNYSLEEDNKVDVFNFLHIKTENIDINESNFENETALELRNSEDNDNFVQEFDCQDNSFESDYKGKSKKITRKKRIHSGMTLIGLLTY